MIITEKIEIKVTKSKIKYYNDLGYNVSDGDIININPIELSKGSHIFIDVECDICHKQKTIMYQKYIKNINNGGIYCCSSKCAQIKVKNTSLKNFGTEYYMQTDEYKSRYEKTSLEKYGTKHHFQSTKIKDKIVETNNERYGVDNVSKSPIIIDKIKQTVITKYGVDNISYLETTKNKIKENYKENREERIQQSKDGIFKKHGVYSIFYVDSIKDKITKIMMERYGVSTAYMIDDNRKKAILSRLNNWKVDKLIDINITNINLSDKLISYKCEKKHISEMNYKTYYNRNISNSIICTICNPINKHISGLEIQLSDFIKNNYDGEIIVNSRSIINPFELDIYLPELNLAFEFNGLYWHNELNKDNDYHKEKSDLCDKKGIQLIHIWEDDWLYKQDIVKSMILNKLRKISERVYGRQTIIKEVTDNKLIRKFLDSNHIQGFVGSQIKLGLFYNDELVSLMTFGKPRKNMNSVSKNNNDYEMLRFCNKLNTNVIGGASKLFKYFLKTYNPSQITTYADRSYSNGNLYKQLGFGFIHITQPNYYYVIDGIRYYRFGFRKDILIKQGYDKNKTEHQIMLERKIYRIYNAGNYKYVFKN